MQIKKTDNPLNYSLKKKWYYKIAFVFIMMGIWHTVLYSRWIYAYRCNQYLSSPKVQLLFPFITRYT